MKEFKKLNMAGSVDFAALLTAEAADGWHPAFSWVSTGQTGNPSVILVRGTDECAKSTSEYTQSVTANEHDQMMTICEENTRLRKELLRVHSMVRIDPNKLIDELESLYLAADGSTYTAIETLSDIINSIRRSIVDQQEGSEPCPKK